MDLLLAPKLYLPTGLLQLQQLKKLSKRFRRRVLKQSKKLWAQGSEKLEEKADEPVRRGQEDQGRLLEQLLKNRRVKRTVEAENASPTPCCREESPASAETPAESTSSRKEEKWSRTCTVATLARNVRLR